MRAHTIGDVTLDLNPVALAALQLLAAREPDYAKWSDRKGGYDVDLSTHAFYNGRERGFVITQQRFGSGAKPFHVLLVEQRNSDNIVVASWTGEHDINPPTAYKYSPEAYSKAKEFGWNQFHLAVEHVYGLLARQYRRVLAKCSSS